MQSVQTEIIEKQIRQLFTEVISIWRESDIKKNEAVRRLAARLEEYYLQQNQPQEIQYICKKIVDKLKENGLEATANHAYDYLDDKYKQPEFQHYRSGTGPVVAKIDIEHCKTLNPLDLDIEIKRTALEEITSREKFRDDQAESDKHFKAAILEAAKVQNQAMNFAEDSFSSSTDKKWEPIHTDIPYYNYEGDIYQACKDYEGAVKRYYDTVRSIKEDWFNWGKFETPEEKIIERKITKAIHHEIEFFDTLNEMHGPFKDLKYAVSQKSWFYILQKFLDHGKHAAAVMDPIPSHSNPDKKRTLTREEVGDEVGLKEELLINWARSRDYVDHVEGKQVDPKDTAVEILREFITKLVHSYGDDPYLIQHIKSWFINHPLRVYDRDEETIVPLRKELTNKLITSYANRGDYFDQSSDYRDDNMNPTVATRRIGAHDTLSGLA